MTGDTVFGFSLGCVILIALLQMNPEAEDGMPMGSAGVSRVLCNYTCGSWTFKATVFKDPA